MEVAASIDYKEFGLKESLSAESIKLITSSAIEYFKDVDLDSLSTKINLVDDYYYNITQKYETAYFALVELGKCSDDKLEIEFKKYLGEPYILDELISNEKKVDVEKISNNEKIEDIANGINDTLAPALTILLKGILNKESSILYVDSFKYLSRNFEINLKVLQFLLTNDAMFLTNNFLIRNGYVSRRKKLIRASHGSIFNVEAISSIGDVSKKYENYLETMLRNVC